MPDKLRLARLPKGFKLVSAYPNQKAAQTAIISYHSITPGFSLIEKLLKSTHARTVNMQTPFEQDGTMHFHVDIDRSNDTMPEL